VSRALSLSGQRQEHPVSAHGVGIGIGFRRRIQGAGSSFREEASRTLC